MVGAGSKPIPAVCLISSVDCQHGAQWHAATKISELQNRASAFSGLVTRRGSLRQVLTDRTNELRHNGALDVFMAKGAGADIERQSVEKA